MTTTDNNNEPLFVFGFERSGTTLISMMLGAHPALAVPLTVTGLWYRYARELGRYNSLATPEDVAHLVDDLLAEERIRLWDAQLDRAWILHGLEPGNYPQTVAHFHAAYAQAKGKPRWGNIDIATLDDMDMAHRWFPGARFIHIVRDGRDIALSHETMPYGASNAMECAERWQQRLRTNLKMGAMLDATRYLVVRYEDLVQQPESALRRLCAFAGLSYAREMLDYTRMVEEKVPEDKRWLWPALNQPPNASKAFGWKREMSEAKRLVFESVAGDMLRELRYETYQRVPKSPRRFFLEAWYWFGRGGRFKRAAAKLGLRRKSLLERSWARGAARPVRAYESAQTQSFGQLVRSGIYGKDFRHAEPARTFFVQVMSEVLQRHPRGAVSVLECGIGPGAWLECLLKDVAGGAQRPLEVFGFDLTEEMVAVARARLARVPARNLRQGDILERDTYSFDQPGRQFDVVFAYDVVQQLPRELQLRACQTMLKSLATGGTLVIFDHDCASRHGRIMGAKKFVTRYLGWPLVPRYYCNARYPALKRIATRLRAPGCKTRVHIAPDGRKRALIVELLGAHESAPLASSGGLAAAG